MSPSFSLPFLRRVVGERLFAGKAALLSTCSVPMPSPIALLLISFLPRGIGRAAGLLVQKDTSLVASSAIFSMAFVEVAPFAAVARGSDAFVVRTPWSSAKAMFGIDCRKRGKYMCSLKPGGWNFEILNHWIALCRLPSFQKPHSRWKRTAKGSRQLSMNHPAHSEM